MYVGQTSQSLRQRLVYRISSQPFQIRLNFNVHVFQAKAMTYPSWITEIEQALITTFEPAFNKCGKHRKGRRQKGNYLPARDIHFDLDAVMNVINNHPRRVIEIEYAHGRPYPVLDWDITTGKTGPCPFCDKRHIHGVGGNGGHRTPHCGGDDIIFRELVVDGERIEQFFGYILRPKK